MDDHQGVTTELPEPELPGPLACTLDDERCSPSSYSKATQPFLQKLQGSPLTTADSLCLKVATLVTAISKELLETQLICFNGNSVAVGQHWKGLLLAGVYGLSLQTESLLHCSSVYPSSCEARAKNASACKAPIEEAHSLQKSCQFCLTPRSPKGKWPLN